MNRKRRFLSYVLAVALVVAAVFVLPLTAAGSSDVGANVSAFASVKYTATFNSQGGSPVKAKFVAAGGKIGALKTPQNKGFTFKGWYTKPAGGKKITKNTRVRANAVYYAHYEARKGYVQATFKAYDYNIYKAYKKGVQLGAAVSKKAVRADYTFLGWYTKAVGGKKITKSVKIKKKTIYYAHWKKSVAGSGDKDGNNEPTPAPSPTPNPNPNPQVTVVVTLNANGGTTGSASKTVTVGQTYGTLPTARRPGMLFAGWHTATSGGSEVTETTVVTVTSNHTLYAHWTLAVPVLPSSITVSFNANGGIVGTVSTVVTVSQTYGTLPTATRTGYTFKGWYTAASGGTQVTASTTVTNTANHTLYAQWTAQAAQTITVIFDPALSCSDFGWASSSSLVDISSTSKTVTVGQTYGTLPTPTSPTGWTFVAWLTANVESAPRVTSSTTVTNAGNHTLYGLWKRDLNTAEQWYVNGSGSAWFACLSDGTPFGPNKTFHSNGTYIYVDGYDNYVGFWKVSGNTITHYVWVQANNGAWLYDGTSIDTVTQKGTWPSSGGGGSYFAYPSSIAGMTSIWRNLRTS